MMLQNYSKYQLHTNKPHDTKYFINSSNNVQMMTTNTPRNFTTKGIFSSKTVPILEFEAPICSLIVVHACTRFHATKLDRTIIIFPKEYLNHFVLGIISS